MEYTLGSELSNTVWSVVRKYPTSTADVIRPALVNNASVLKNNAYWSVSADGTYAGISNTTNAVTLSHAPILGVPPAYGSPLALAGAGGYIPYDSRLAARNVVTPTIGPLEMQTRLLIDPTAAEMATQIWSLSLTEGSAVADSMGSNVGLVDDVASETSNITTTVDTTSADVSSIRTKTDYLPSATAGTAGGVFIAGSNAATTVNITGTLSGNVGGIGIGGITTASFAAGAIDAAAIATDAIGAAEIAANAIDSGALASDAITSAKIGADAIGASEIATGAIDSTAIAAGAISAGTIAADAFTAAKFDSDVTTEFQSGLATSAALATVGGYIDTEVSAIKTKTDFLPSAAAGGAGGVLIAGSNEATTFATLTSTGAFTVNGVSNIAQTGDSFARIGATGSGLTSLATQTSVNDLNIDVDTVITNLDGNTSTLATISAAVDSLPTNAELDTALEGIDLALSPEDLQEIVDGISEDLTVSATYVNSARTYRFENPSDVTAVNTVYENTGYDGLIRMDFNKALSGEVVIHSITSVTATTQAGDAATDMVTLGTATKTPDSMGVDVPVEAIEAGNYRIIFTILTTDSQTIVRKGRLVIR